MTPEGSVQSNLSVDAPSFVPKVQPPDEVILHGTVNGHVPSVQAQFPYPGYAISPHPYGFATHPAGPYFLPLSAFPPPPPQWPPPQGPRPRMSGHGPRPRHSSSRIQDKQRKSSSKASRPQDSSCPPDKSLPVNGVQGRPITEGAVKDRIPEAETDRNSPITWSRIAATPKTAATSKTSVRLKTASRTATAPKAPLTSSTASKNTAVTNKPAQNSAKPSNRATQRSEQSSKSQSRSKSRDSVKAGHPRDSNSLNVVKKEISNTERLKSSQDAKSDSGNVIPVSNQPATLSYAQMLAKPAVKATTKADIASTDAGRSQLSAVSDNAGTSQPEDGAGGTTKKKRRRRKKNKSGGTCDDNVRATGVLPISVLGVEPKQVAPPLSDTHEFPDLSGAVSDSNAAAVPTLLSYSSALKTSVYPKSDNDVTSRTGSISGQEESNKSVKANRSSKQFERKKRRKREKVAAAADQELMEISLAQQMLRQKQKEKSKQDVTVDLSSLITSAIKVNQSKAADDNAKSTQATSQLKLRKVPDAPKALANTLDASAPAKRRGKEREIPKQKRKTTLKRVILKEREERRRQRLIGEGLYEEEEQQGSSSDGDTDVAEDSTQADHTQDSSQSTQQANSPPLTPVAGVSQQSQELSPISQPSPISLGFSPGDSPLHLGYNPLTGYTPDERGNEIKAQIHSRRFREYCTQVLTSEIDETCVKLLQDLVRFQDRLYHKDPVKAKSRRRLVMGLREVAKHLKLRNIKCVIISPNVERIKAKGGLDDALNKILLLCRETGIPFVFALGRLALGRAVAKTVPVSVVGIFNFEGSEEAFHRLLALTESAREQYEKLVADLQQEWSEVSSHLPATLQPGMIYAHLGHSRTPSGCSGISFTSSVLSEPISENYPYSEPETDSRGYEVTVKHKTGTCEQDPGNEADTEEIPHEPATTSLTRLSETAEELHFTEETDEDTCKELNESQNLSSSCGTNRGQGRSQNDTSSDNTQDLVEPTVSAPGRTTPEAASQTSELSTLVVQTQVAQMSLSEQSTTVTADSSRTGRKETNRRIENWLAGN